MYTGLVRNFCFGLDAPPWFLPHFLRGYLVKYDILIHVAFLFEIINLVRTFWCKYYPSYLFLVRPKLIIR